MEQPRLFEHQDDRREFQPLPQAQEWLRQESPSWSAEGLDTQFDDPQRSYAVYLGYRDNQRRARERQSAGKPPPQGLQRSYQALGHHIGKQFDSMMDAGVVDVDPVLPLDDTGGYRDAGHMVDDMRSRGRFNVSTTDDAQGTVAWDNDTNDKFRAVHDVVGHAASGRGFSTPGEFAATESHRRSLPPEAHRAITSEVAGQAAFARHGGGFTDQDALVDAPLWFRQGKQMPTPPQRAHISRFKQGRLFQ